jgi:uncharacterized membrane protein YhhN
MRIMVMMSVPVKTALEAASSPPRTAAGAILSGAFSDTMLFVVQFIVKESDY